MATSAVEVLHWRIRLAVLVRFNEVISTAHEVVAPEHVADGLLAPSPPPPPPPPGLGNWANAKAHVSAAVKAYFIL